MLIIHYIIEEEEEECANEVTLDMAVLVGKPMQE
jgi:hypothetical protein